jgi:16S rRNA G966 N2-methylase RsmD
MALLRAVAAICLIILIIIVSAILSRRRRIASCPCTGSFKSNLCLSPKRKVFKSNLCLSPKRKVFKSNLCLSPKRKVFKFPMFVGANSPILAVGGKGERPDQSSSRFPEAIIGAAKQVPEAASIGYENLETVGESVYSSLMPRDIPAVRRVLRTVWPESSPTRVIDATAHIGVDSLNFVSTFPGVKEVTSVELGDRAYAALVHNTRGKPIKTVHRNAVNYLQGEPGEADIVYFDPPWGGPGKRGHQIGLYDESGKNWSLPELVRLVFGRRIAPIVLLKLPAWYALQTLTTSVADQGRITLYPVGFKRVSYWLMAIAAEK